MEGVGGRIMVGTHPVEYVREEERNARWVKLYRKLNCQAPVLWN